MTTFPLPLVLGLLKHHFLLLVPDKLLRFCGFQTVFLLLALFNRLTYQFGCHLLKNTIYVEARLG